MIPMILGMFDLVLFYFPVCLILSLLDFYWLFKEQDRHFLARSLVPVALKIGNAQLIQIQECQLEQEWLVISAAQVVVGEDDDIRFTHLFNNKAYWETLNRPSLTRILATVQDGLIENCMSTPLFFSNFYTSKHLSGSCSSCPGSKPKIQ